MEWRVAALLLVASVVAAGRDAGEATWSPVNADANAEEAEDGALLPFEGSPQKIMLTIPFQEVIEDLEEDNVAQTFSTISSPDIATRVHVGTAGQSNGERDKNGWEYQRVNGMLDSAIDGDGTKSVRTLRALERKAEGWWEVSKKKEDDLRSRDEAAGSGERARSTRTKRKGQLIYAPENPVQDLKKNEADTTTIGWLATVNSEARESKAAKVDDMLGLNATTYVTGEYNSSQSVNDIEIVEYVTTNTPKTLDSEGTDLKRASFISTSTTGKYNSSQPVNVLEIVENVTTNAPEKSMDTERSDLNISASQKRKITRILEEERSMAMKPSAETDGAGEREDGGQARAALVAALTESAAAMPWLAPGLSSLLRSPARDLANVTERCLQDLQRLTQAFALRRMWALKMFDASTKMPGGVLFGHLSHLGNFDECLSVVSGQSGESSGGPGIDGQHCLVSLSVGRLAGDDAEQELSPRPHWEEITFAAHLQAGRVRAPATGSPWFPLQVAWCVPSSCAASEVEQLAQLALELAHINTTATVAPSQCHTRANTHKPLRAIDIFAVFVLAVFAALAAASTAYDMLTHWREERRPLLLAFSVYTNVPKLVDVSHKQDQLTCLNGIRVISIGWVVLGHVYLNVVLLPSLNLVDYVPNFLQSFGRLVITNGTLSVDSFLLMSGLLLSYLFLKDVANTGRFRLVPFYVHRYVRLTPSLAILILLTVTLANYTATGPLWDSHQEVSRTSCEKNWWSNLLYINNYVGDVSEKCCGHTWYLAVDMQLFWLSPLLLLPLWLWPKRVVLGGCALLLLVGWAVPFAIVYVRHLLPSFISTDVVHLTDTMKYYYIPSYTRYTPWLLGILLGHVLHEARKNRPHIPKAGVALGWLLSALLMGVALGAAYPFQQLDHPYSRVEAAFWMSLFRPMWALGLAWIVFACDQGYGGIVNSLLSWNLFQPLARLSYSIYLVHYSVLDMFAASTQTPIYLSDITVISQFFAVFVMSVMWAVPMTLIFEFPIVIIEKAIFGGRSSPQSENQVEYQNVKQHEESENSSNA